MTPRRVDRLVVRVEAVEARVRKRLRHQQRRVAVAAADVGHRDAGFELRDHAVERRQPLRHEARAVAVAVERGDAARHARVVLAPRDAAAGAKRIERLRLVGPHRRRQVPRMRDVVRALFVGEHHRVLGRELVGVAHRVVADVAACRLLVQPFAHVALGAAGAPRELFRAQRAGAGQRLVQPELAAQADHDAVVRRRDVADRARRERVELGLIDHGGVHDVHSFRRERRHQCSGGSARATAWPMLRPCARPSFTACRKWMPAYRRDRPFSSAACEKPR